ncbi:MAG: hypothetical protein HWE27_11300 [Gammaproteobacteria bacterium]|nr:hypothetical protein [Gammaproteobacteria bacterium]
MNEHEKTCLINKLEKNFRELTKTHYNYHKNTKEKDDAYHQNYKRLKEVEQQLKDLGAFKGPFLKDV